MTSTNKITLWFIIGFLVLVIAGVTAAYMVSGGTAGSSKANPSFIATSIPPLAATDWTQGDKASKVSVVEYGDFECPACAAYQPLVKQILTDYGSKIILSFRNFPLYQVHQDAGISAQAVEAAGLQGKYWEMHDLLYAKQTEWSVISPDQVVGKFFNDYAESLGLDVAKFDKDINSTVVTNKIQADVASGNSAQIDHTPTFFINLKQIPNPTSYADFKAAMDAALAAQ